MTASARAAFALLWIVSVVRPFLTSVAIFSMCAGSIVSCFTPPVSTSSRPVLSR